MKNIALIYNPTEVASHKAEPMAKDIADILGINAISYTLFTNIWPSEWEGYTEIWIVGGDGTLHYFINQYPENQLPLVLFPGGSGNDFHWTIYGKINPAAQIQQVLNGKLKFIDAGICNGQWFLNGVGIGFDGAIVKDLVGKRKRAGKTSYLLSIIKNIVGYKERRYFIQTDTSAIERDCFMISVANGKRYGGGFLVAPNALLNDETFDIVIISKIPVWKRLRYLPVMERGLHLGLPFVQHQKCKQVVINTAGHVPAHIDGEYISGKQFMIQLAVKKIAFVV